MIKSRLSCTKVNLCSVAGDKLYCRLLHISPVTEKRLSTATCRHSEKQTKAPATSESYSCGLSRTTADSASTWTGFLHKEWTKNNYQPLSWTSHRLLFSTVEWNFSAQQVIRNSCLRQVIVVFYREHWCIITTFTPCKSLWSRLSRRQNRRLSRILFSAGGLAKSMAAKLEIFFGRRPAAYRSNFDPI